MDHNPDSVKICKELGLKAFTPTNFFATSSDEKFQTLLLSHVIEHLTLEQARSVIEQYLPYMDKNAQVVIICPQQRGFASDDTHVTYFEENAIKSLLDQLGCGPTLYRSFPFPKAFGRLFIYNEHVAVAQLVDS